MDIEVIKQKMLSLVKVYASEEFAEAELLYRERGKEYSSLDPTLSKLYLNMLDAREALMLYCKSRLEK